MPVTEPRHCPGDAPSSPDALPATWPQTTVEAIALQQALRTQVVTKDRLGTVHRVGGLDVGLEGDDAVVRAAVAVLSFPDLRTADQAVARRPVTFRYVPGLLSFREVPALLDALDDGGRYCRPLADRNARYIGWLMVTAPRRSPTL